MWSEQEVNAELKTMTTTCWFSAAEIYFYLVYLYVIFSFRFVQTPTDRYVVCLVCGDLTDQTIACQCTISD